MKQIVYLDMDGVLADYKAALEAGNKPEDKAFFRYLAVMPGAVQAFRELQALGFDVYILTTAPWSKIHASSEKREWVEKHLGEGAFKRLIITHRKDLNRGDFLVDDRTENGAAEFEGQHIHFGQPPFQGWPETMAFFRKVAAGEVQPVDESDDTEAENLLAALKAEIRKAVAHCNGSVFPILCNFRSTPDGKNKLEMDILNRIVRDGATIASAMNDIENEYNQNRATE